MSDKKLCVIMQPTYLPWVGYFDLIAQSQVFIFGDSVQFEKQSWQQRNRIRTARGLEWLTVPVLKRHDQLIREVEIIQSKRFPGHHLRVLQMNYKRSPYFDRYFPELSKIIASDNKSLSKLNIQIIKWLASAMGIDANFVNSSDLENIGKRTSLAVNLCRQVDANLYLSPIGAKEYLALEHQKFAAAGIEVSLHNYKHPEYTQLYEPFIPYASVIDLLFNEGDRSLEIICSGRRKPFELNVPEKE